MHENCNCLQFHDVTLTLILDAVYTCCLNLLQNSFTFDAWRIFQSKETNVATFFVKSHAGTEKSLSDFWAPLLE